MKPFWHYTAGSITWGLYDGRHYVSPFSFRVMLDWRDAADGRTLIWPMLRLVRGGRS